MFISYAHETPEHKKWVARLAADLIENGVNTTLDQWDLKYGSDLTLFMEEGIRSADRVLLICTPLYARKANEGTGGVAYERLIVTGELAERIDTTKFVCVLRDGSRDTAIPVFAKTRLFIDFTDDSSYRVALEELLRDIHEAPQSPKPTLGTNPFMGIVRTQGVSLAESLPDTEPGDNLEELIRKGTVLLRSRDLLGWKRLVRGVQSEYAGHILAWRPAAESTVNTTNEKWISSLDTLVETGAPLISLALLAADSGLEEIRNQRGLIDDLITPVNWQRGGFTTIVAAPLLLGMLYNYSLGALHVMSGHLEDALELLSTRVRRERTGDLVEVWRYRELMGSTSTLGGNYAAGWQYLNSLYSKQQWLTHFFARPDHYSLGLRAYQFTASILDLCSFIRNKGTEEQLEGRGGIDVIPMFMLPTDDWYVDVTDVVSRVFPNQRAVALVCDAQHVDEKELKRLWPRWYARLFRAIHSNRPMLDAAEPPPLPE